MGNIKKRIICVLLLICTLVLPVCLSGCTKKVSEEEAKEIVGYLVSESYEINDIVYGKGLETIEIEEEENYLYATVAENDKYNSTNDIRNEIYRLFSSKYAANMEATALVGITGEISGSIVYARYIDGKYGLAMLKDDIALKGDVEVEGGKEEIEYEGMKVLKFDPSTVEIQKISRKFIDAYVTSEDGTTKILVSLILENGEWKLNCTTC